MKIRYSVSWLSRLINLVIASWLCLMWCVTWIYSHCTHATQPNISSWTKSETSIVVIPTMTESFRTHLPTLHSCSAPHKKYPCGRITWTLASSYSRASPQCCIYTNVTVQRCSRQIYNYSSYIPISLLSALLMFTYSSVKTEREWERVKSLKKGPEQSSWKSVLFRLSVEREQCVRSFGIATVCSWLWEIWIDNIYVVSTCIKLYMQLYQSCISITVDVKFLSVIFVYFFSHALFDFSISVFASTRSNEPWLRW